MLHYVFKSAISMVFWSIICHLWLIWFGKEKIVLCRLRWFKFNWYAKMCQSPMGPIAHVPIAHVPHHPCPPSISNRYWQYSLNTWSCTCSPCAHVISQVSKRCQVVKKMSNMKKSNMHTMEEVHKKNKFDIMRFTDIDINFDVKYEGHQNCPKILSVNILRVFSDHHMWHQNWRQYLWTSLCQFIFIVNLLHSPGVWFFHIWHLFDNLTSFWQLDIFLTLDL